LFYIKNVCYDKYLIPVSNTKQQGNMIILGNKELEPFGLWKIEKADENSFKIVSEYT